MPVINACNQLKLPSESHCHLLAVANMQTPGGLKSPLSQVSSQGGPFFETNCRFHEISGISECYSSVLIANPITAKCGHMSSPRMMFRYSSVSKSLDMTFLEKRSKAKLQIGGFRQI
jgi:hypothetical protein